MPESHEQNNTREPQAASRKTDKNCLLPVFFVYNKKRRLSVAENWHQALLLRGAPETRWLLGK